MTVATIKIDAAIVQAYFGNNQTEMMLNSGSAVSLVRQDIVKSCNTVSQFPFPQIQLVTASGDKLPITDYVRVPIEVQGNKLSHDFLVVNKLITPVILGIDFLQKHKLTLNFSHSPVVISSTNHTTSRPVSTEETSDTAKSIWIAQQKVRQKYCGIIGVDDKEGNIDDCTVPKFDQPIQFDFPHCTNSTYDQVIQEYKELFRTSPGKTTAAHHYIPTSGTPTKVSPRRIPAHFKDEVTRQLQVMLEQGIIEESNSPWMSPMVFVRKKTGDLRLCVDYRQVNKKTTKDAYPLPLPDEVQDRLAKSTVFSTLDLQSGYWQLPVSIKDREKTAFCPGPGMGLFQFCRMPFGLTGAPASFQRLMDKILRGLPFASTYIDDILVFSSDPITHKEHLNQVFACLQEAGLTLRGKKCHIGLNQVSYLGHVFSGQGMSPDPRKTQVIVNWPQPTSVAEVRQFIGLASYYRRYIADFAQVAAPLHQLMQKRQPLTGVLTV